MGKKYIGYEDLIRNQKKINELKKSGFILIPKKNFKILGWVLIGLGLATCWIPLTTVPLVTAGFLSLGISKRELLEKIRRKHFLFNYKKRGKKDEKYL